MLRILSRSRGEGPTNTLFERFAWSEVDDPMTFDCLAFGFIAKRYHLFVINDANIKRTKAGDDHFTTFVEVRTISSNNDSTASLAQRALVGVPFGDNCD